MSAQIRYRTLVNNIGRIYAAPTESRTTLLQTGLDEIVTVTAPTSATGWQTVGADSRRLLRVWAAKETDPAAGEVVEQLTDLLTEMAALKVSDPPPQLVIPPSPPSLMVFEKPADALVAIPQNDLIALAHAATLEGSVASSISEEEMEEAAELLEVEEDEEEEVAPVKPAAAAASHDLASAVNAKQPPVKVVAEEVVEEEEVMEEEEVVEEEEVMEEEEEGLEVEPISIRGRKYWLGSDQKLYAVIDDDDVGDAVGEMIDGKPRFYAK